MLFRQRGNGAAVGDAQELIKRGWYLGFDGPLTYKNAKKTVEVAKIVPLDRVLLETDSPYMVNKIQGATGGNRQAHAPVVGRL